MTLVAAVDIGTNSMRLLITDGLTDLGRWEEVTGLGRGVDRTGELAPDAVAMTIGALEGFGRLMDNHAVGSRLAIATSASRDATNREPFFDAAEAALGVRPTLVDGNQEARLAYAGATRHFRGPEPAGVCDIGGGSTELVTERTAVSVDIGSVRMTERAIPSRPAPADELKAARALAREMFSGIDFPRVATLIGVAGTWTELPGLARRADSPGDAHGMSVSRGELAEVIDRLSGLTVEETAKLPSLNPQRAPVILGGAVVAEAVMEVVGVDEATASTHDILDGVAMKLLDLP